jgi:hypothetical protein
MWLLKQKIPLLDKAKSGKRNMILGQALETFLLMAVAAALTTMAVLLTPIFISKVRPTSYRGFWKVAGDFLKE